MQSGLGREVAHVIESDPNVASLTGGVAMASAESVVLTNLERKSGGIIERHGARGRRTRPRPATSIRIAEGRAFRPGVDEVIVGSALSRRFLGCQLGATLRFGSRDWLVVGIFEAGGSGFESEIWGDVESLLPAFDRDAFSSVTMRLLDPDAFADDEEAPRGRSRACTSTSSARATTTAPNRSSSRT